MCATDRGVVDCFTTWLDSQPSDLLFRRKILHLPCKVVQNFIKKPVNHQIHRFVQDFVKKI